MDGFVSCCLCGLMVFQAGLKNHFEVFHAMQACYFCGDIFYEQFLEEHFSEKHANVYNFLATLKKQSVRRNLFNQNVAELISDDDEEETVSDSFSKAFNAFKECVARKEKASFICHACGEEVGNLEELKKYKEEHNSNEDMPAYKEQLVGKDMLADDLWLSDDESEDMPVFKEHLLRNYMLSDEESEDMPASEPTASILQKRKVNRTLA